MNRTRWQTTVIGLMFACAGRMTAQSPFLNINPAWSPDGKHLVFQSERVAGRTNLYIINVDGTGERRLTWTAGDDTHPSWSPDGNTIVFDSNRDGVWNLYAIHIDGTTERRLTYPGASRRPMFGRHPTWSPDGRRIAFDSDRDGGDAVYVMSADGSETRRLTTPTSRAGHASWSPDGR